MKRVAWLLAAFVTAVFLRLLVGGPGASQSPIAGLVFAACLLVLTAKARPLILISWRVLLTGLAGAIVICLPVAVHRLLGISASHLPFGNFFLWGLVVTIVALSEELFLRGSLFDAVTAWRGEATAVIVCAACFTALHIPLYGWGVVPLDLAVGTRLGLLRISSRTAVAPAVAHVAADLAGWWLR